MDGHQALLNDLENLLVRATRCEFHTLKSPSATPITDLVTVLNVLQIHAKSGRYDCLEDDAASSTTGGEEKP